MLLAEEALGGLEELAISGTPSSAAASFSSAAASCSSVAASCSFSAATSSSSFCARSLCCFDRS